MKLNTFIKTTNAIFDQLKWLIENLNDEEYTRQIVAINNNSIAKHIRHVLELYEELLNGSVQGFVNYDARKRNLLIEQNRLFTLQFMHETMHKLQLLEEDNSIVLYAKYDGEETEVIISSINRELAYNIEHAIHHMAIIQIVCKLEISHIVLPSNFGVAYSTIQHQKNVHANVYT